MIIIMSIVKCFNGVPIAHQKENLSGMFKTFIIKRFKCRGGSLTSKPIKGHKKHLYPLKVQRDAQYNYDKKSYEEIVSSQKKRAFYG